MCQTFIMFNVSFNGTWKGILRRNLQADLWDVVEFLLDFLYEVRWVSYVWFEFSIEGFHCSARKRDKLYVKECMGAAYSWYEDTAELNSVNSLFSSIINIQISTSL